MPHKLYGRLLQTRPYLTGSVTAAFLFSAGDVLAQSMENKGTTKSYEPIRTARLGLYGGVIFSPLITKWYTLLHRVTLKTQLQTTLVRTVLDQFAFTPFVVSVFFTSMSLIEGYDLNEAKRRLNASYSDTLLKNWGVFIPVQLANFTLVPPHARVLVVNIVALFWNAYLSYANSQSKIAVVEE